MTCPHCHLIIGPRDGTYVTWRGGERIVSHSECHARARWTQPLSADQQLAEKLVDIVRAKLEVGVIDGQTPEEWRESRARNLVQQLINDFEITERKGQ